MAQIGHIPFDILRQLIDQCSILAVELFAFVSLIILLSREIRRQLQK